MSTTGHLLCRSRYDRYIVKIQLITPRTLGALHQFMYFCAPKLGTMVSHYETVFILNPVLSDTQIEETVKKFEDFLVKRGAKMVAKEDWGLKKLAYPIQNKKSGFYHLFEFSAEGEVIDPYETEFRRDERVMRFLTVKLDKHAVAWAEKRRAKLKTA